MPATLTGTPVAINWAAGASPAAQNIVIPSDATGVYAKWAFDGVDANGHGLASGTLNGNAPTRTFQIPTAAGFYPATGVVFWYLPATGTRSLQLAWTIAPVEGPTCIVFFTKDGPSDGWRDADADQDLDATAVSVTLTTIAGDLVVKFDQRFDASENPPTLSAGWTNAATGGNVDEGCRLSYITAAGTTQVCASENESYSSIMAISIPEGAGGATQDLAGAAAAQAAATGNLAKTDNLAGAAAAQAAATGNLTGAATLGGSAAAQAAAAAELLVRGYLVSSAVGNRTNRPGRGPYSSGRYFRPSLAVFANPARFSDLAGSAAVQASAAAALQILKGLAAAASSQASAAATLQQAIGLAVAAASQISATGQISLSVPLAGVASGQAAGSGSLSTNGSVDLAGAAAAQASAGAGLALVVSLAGAAVSQAAASGALSTSSGLLGAAVVVASSTGQLALSIALQGQALAQASASGSINGAVTLGGSAAAAAGVSGTLMLSVPVAGAAQQIAAAGGGLVLTVVLGGAAQARSSAGAAFAEQVLLTGNAGAQVTVTGQLAQFDLAATTDRAWRVKPVPRSWVVRSRFGSRTMRAIQ